MLLFSYDITFLNGKKNIHIVKIIVTFFQKILLKNYYLADYIYNE